MTLPKKDIFADHALYPGNGSILSHYRGVYDAAYIVLMPFVGDCWSDPDALQAGQSYPEDELIYKKGNPLTWKSVIDNTTMSDYAELNRALRTSIGALRPVFRLPELAEELDRYTTDNRIWYPTEGMFDVFSKVSIYRVFTLLGFKEVVLTDEFYGRTATLNISGMNEWEFSEAVQYDHRYIYPAGRELLFTIEWDSFFFIIASDSRTMDRIRAAGLFKGFACDEKTTTRWDYADGELERLIQQEQEIK